MSENLVAVLLTLLIGAIGTALGRIWAAQARLERRIEGIANRLTRLEALLGLPK